MVSVIGLVFILLLSIGNLMSLKSESIKKKTKLTQHIQAILLGGVALQAGFQANASNEVVASAHADAVTVRSMSDTMPVLTSSKNITVEEGHWFPYIGPYKFATPNPNDNENFEYVVSGGADKGVFNFIPDSTGYYVYVDKQLDFEDPFDNNKDNVYEFTITVKNTSTNESSSHNITFTVQDVGELAPLLSFGSIFADEGKAFQFKPEHIQFSGTTDLLNAIQFNVAMNTSFQAYHDANTDGQLTEDEKITQVTNVSYQQLTAGNYYFLHNGDETATEASFTITTRVKADSEFRDYYSWQETKTGKMLINPTDDASEAKVGFIQATLPVLADAIGSTNIVYNSDANGKMYAAFYKAGAVHQYALVNDVWNAIGTVTSKDTTEGKIKIAFAPDNTPYFAYLVEDNTQDTTSIEVLKYNSSTQQVEPLPALAEQGIGFQMLLERSNKFGFDLDNHGTPYLFYQSKQSGLMQLVKYSDSAGWSIEFTYEERDARSDHTPKSISMSRGADRIYFVSSHFGINGTDNSGANITITEGVTFGYITSSGQRYDSGGYMAAGSSIQYDEYQVTGSEEAGKSHFLKVIKSADTTLADTHTEKEIAYGRDKTTNQFGSADSYTRINKDLSSVEVGSTLPYTVEVTDISAGSSTVLVKSIVEGQWQEAASYQVPFEVKVDPVLSVDEQGHLQVYLSGTDAHDFRKISKLNKDSMSRVVTEPWNAQQLFRALRVEDVDSEQVTITIRNNTPNAGALSVAGGFDSSGLHITQSDTANWTATGSLSNINRLIENLRLQSTCDFSSKASVTLSVKHLGDFTELATVELDYTDAQNASQICLTSSLLVDQGNSSTILTTNLNAVEASTNAEQLIYTINAAPQFGTLFLDLNLDGTLEDSEKLTAGSPFSQAAVNSGQLVYQHDASKNASDAINLSLQNSLSNMQLAKEIMLPISITLANEAPVATAQTVFANEDSSVLVTLTAIDINSDGLTYQISQDASSGSLEAQSGDTWLYTPNANFNGEDSFLFVASDGQLPSEPAEVKVTVRAVNDAPEISGTPVTQIDQDSAYQFTPAGTDVDGDTLTFSILNAPKWAKFDKTTGTLSGTPRGSDVGRYENIVISVSDGNSVSALSAFSIAVNAVAPVTPVNTAPTASTVNTSVDEDATVSFGASASDPDGDSLSVSVTTQPANGTVSVQGDLFRYTPNKDFNGVDSFSYRVSDGELSSAEARVNITVNAVNDAPVARAISTLVEEDASVSITGVGSDLDGDKLSFSVTQQPANGTLNLQGNVFNYTPNADFFGADSFSYVVNDGELNSAEAQVSITVKPVNDAPVAQDDEYTFTDAAGRYVLDVLANDSDVDTNDTLTLVAANTTLGSVSIENNQLIYQPQANVQDAAVISYVLTDNQGMRAQATAKVTMSAAQSGAPEISVPEDKTVNATGLFTKVDLGNATATDASGNPLAVSLVDGTTVFAPGIHEVFWTATDSNGESAVKQQTVTVHPLISLSKDSQIAEEQRHTVKVFLNGTSPTYPVTVPYSVSGTADGNDHDLVAGEVVIESGVEGSITFNVFGDGEVEGSESIVITLDDTLNRGSKQTSTVTIVEDNVAPALAVKAIQSGQVRTLIGQDGGVVSVVAEATDANPQDSVTLSWRAEGVENTSTESSRFEFDPAGLEVGTYKLSVTASDNGTPSLSSMQDMYLEVVVSLPALSNQDSDGDLIPDNQEGYTDADNDGIPDYLDANNECNVIPGQVKDVSQYLVEGEPGVCLRKGATVSQNSTGGAQLLEIELPTDSEATNIGGVFDFIATGLPKAGDVYGIVIPQRKPIPVNAIYRKFRDGEWTNFVTTDGNKILSAVGEPGYCPPPGSKQWHDGLSAGDWCVQLQIVDGGANDDDGIANRSVIDPGGIAVMKTTNTQPQAQADAITSAVAQPVFIDVLSNDTDADGDTLTITGASADFGVVEVVDNQLRLTPPLDYIGIVQITYGIADGQGGTSSAEVTVELVVNGAPVTQADTAKTNDKTSVVIDVLVNDSDPDGDALSVVSAAAEHGQVSITTEGTLRYEPKPGFSGEDSVVYQVKDAKGAVSEGVVKVTVSLATVVEPEKPGTPDTKPETRSSGSVGGILVVMVSALLLRRRKKTLPNYAIATASCLASATAVAQLPHAQNEAHYASYTVSAVKQVGVPSSFATLRYLDLGEGRVALNS